MKFKVFNAFSIVLNAVLVSFESVLIFLKGYLHFSTRDWGAESAYII